MSEVLKKYWSGWEGGWYILPDSHLHFLKFNSIKKPSILSGKLCFVNILFGIPSLTYMIIPLPFLFLSNLQGLEYPSIWNWETGNVLSSFISVIIKILSIHVTSPFKSSNVFGRELMLRLAIMTLFIFSILVFLSMERQSGALWEFSEALKIDS